MSNRPGTYELLGEGVTLDMTGLLDGRVVPNGRPLARDLATLVACTVELGCDGPDLIVIVIFHLGVLVKSFCLATQFLITHPYTVSHLPVEIKGN